jgi:flagellar basal-body rod protein FlgC
MVAINGLGPAVTGLQSARQQLQVSANNVANLRSVAAETVDGPARDEAGRSLFRPGRTVLEAQETGGVRASVQPVDPPAVPRVEPDAADADAEGLVNRPNVSLVEETATQIKARAQFAANLATVETSDEMTERLLDISE